MKVHSMLRHTTPRSTWSRRRSTNRILSSISRFFSSIIWLLISFCRHAERTQCCEMRVDSQHKAAQRCFVVVTWVEAQAAVSRRLRTPRTRPTAVAVLMAVVSANIVAMAKKFLKIFPPFWRKMGAALFAGCLVTSLGPATVVFLLAVAPHANLVVLVTFRSVASAAQRAPQPPSAAAVTRACAAQRILLGLLNVCGVAGVAGNPGAASELICFPPPRCRIPGPPRWRARVWLRCGMTCIRLRV
jgi:hypothetical protein